MSYIEEKEVKDLINYLKLVNEAAMAGKIKSVIMSLAWDYDEHEETRMHVLMGDPKEMVFSSALIQYSVKEGVDSFMEDNNACNFDKITKQ